jgi:hypothetical protein
MDTQITGICMDFAPFLFERHFAAFPAEADVFLRHVLRGYLPGGHVHSDKSYLVLLWIFLRNWQA